MGVSPIDKCVCVGVNVCVRAYRGYIGMRINNDFFGNLLSRFSVEKLFGCVRAASHQSLMLPWIFGVKHWHAFSSGLPLHFTPFQADIEHYVEQHENADMVWYALFNPIKNVYNILYFFPSEFKSKEKKIKNGVICSLGGWADNAPMGEIYIKIITK